MADIVQSLPNEIRVIERSRLGFAEAYTIPDITNISYNTHSTATTGTSIGASGSSSMRFSPGGRPVSFSMNSSNGFSSAHGTTEQTAGFIDLTGDGLPDHIDGRTIRMNYGRGSFRPAPALFNFSCIGGILNTGSSSTRGISWSIGDGISAGSGSSTSGSISANAGVGGSINYSVSVMETNSMLIDMTGNGLPDMVRAEGGRIFIRFNLGSRFVEEEASFYMHGWNDSNMSNLHNRIDGQLITNLFGRLPMIGGAADSFISRVVAHNIRLGIDLREHADSLESNSTITAGVSVSGNFGSSIRIPTPTTFAPMLGININMGAGGGFNTGTSLNGVMVRMMDMTGDGLPDRVLRIPDTRYLLVQRNLAGRVGLLRKISLPQGGEIELDYEWIMGTPQMQRGRHVLSSLTRRDNSGAGGLFLPAFEARASTPCASPMRTATLTAPSASSTGSG